MRRKMIFTLVLTIVSSVWMTSKAMCQVNACTCLFDDPPVAISGILQLVPLPCPESTEDIPCPPCLTIALNANEQLYYLNVWNDNLNALLDTLVYPVNATVTGHVYTALEGGLAIRVQDISLHASLPSLCDEWNVLEISNVTCGYCEEYRTYNFHLTTDTVIGGLLYSQLIKDGAYKGALREGNNRDIYCVPAGCSQEYLLYAFNAQVGDSLKNIWVGGNSSWIPDVRSAIVSEIKQTTPRTIELEVHYYEAPDAYEESIRNLTWIEGIGMPFGPMGAECSVFNGCADSRAKLLLCAYKNGEQVYVSDMGEQYGCEYNYNPDTTHTDTIPVYQTDDPGSSTVDPVDPNQVVVTLTGDQLKVWEASGDEIGLSLSKQQPNHAQAQNQAPRTQTFRHEVSVQLTEKGKYMLVLTNSNWDYMIYGTFDYPRAPQNINQADVSLPAAEKILFNGEIFILRGEKVYNVTGVQLK